MASSGVGTVDDFPAVACPRLIDDIASDLITGGSLTYTGARLYDGDSVVEVNLGRLRLHGDRGPQPAAEQLAKAMAYLCRLQKSIWRLTNSCLFVVRCDHAGRAAWTVLQTAVLILKRSYTVNVPWRLLFIRSGQADENNCDQMERDLAVTSSELENLSLASVTSVERLSCIMDVDQLTNDFGGSTKFNGADWLRFRQKLEPLLFACRSAAKKYVLLLQMLKNVEQKYGDERAWLSLSASSVGEDVSRLESAIVQVEQDTNTQLVLDEGDVVITELSNEFSTLQNLSNYNESLKQVVSLIKELKRVCASARRKTDSCVNDLRRARVLKASLAELDSLSQWFGLVKAIFNERFCMAKVEVMDAAVLNHQFKHYCAHSVEPKLAEFHEKSQKCQQDFDESTFILSDEQHRRIRQQLDELNAKYRFVQGLMDKAREDLECAASCEQLLSQVCDWILIGFQFANQLAQQMPLFGVSEEARSCGERQLDLLNIFLSKYPAASEQQIQQMDMYVERVGCERLRQKNLLVKSKWRKVLNALEDLRRKLHNVLNDSGRPSAPATTLRVPSVDEEVEAHYEEPLRRNPAVHEETGASASLTMDYRRHSYAGINLHKSSSSVADAPASMSTNASSSCSLESGSKVKSSSGLHELNTVGDKITSQITNTPNSRVVDRLRSERSSASLSNAMSTIAEVWLKSRLRKVTAGRNKPSKPDRYKSIENIAYSDVDACSLAERIRPMSVVQIPACNSSAANGVNSRGADDNLQKMVLKELIDTERNYVSSLRYVIDNYIPEMLRADLPSQLLGKRYVIFGNIEKIYEFHVTEFIPDILNHCTETTPRLGMAVAKRFLQHESRFGLYALYNKNLPKSNALMTDCGSVFFQPKQLVLRDKLNLSSYLLKPVQRIGKYVLMLDLLIKGCSEADQQQLNLLHDAREMVIFKLRHGDDLLAMDSIRGCDLNLKEQGGLIRQDEFVVQKGRGGRKCIRRIFLFENLVLFSKPRKSRPGSLSSDVFDYKQSIKMTDVGLTESVSNAPLKFELWFRRRTSSELFIIQASNETQKQAWIADISQLLWKQAISNRESRIAELSSMGIMATTCFELNSANRIEDREVAFNRESRLRNTLSCTVAKHDVRPLFDRRPRSWMSAASSSSSTWSSISGSTNSYCAPESIPLSYESGIATDLGRLDECPDDGFMDSWENEEDCDNGSTKVKDSCHKSEDVRLETSERFADESLTAKMNAFNDSEQLVGANS